MPSASAYSACVTANPPSWFEKWSEYWNSEATTAGGSGATTFEVFAQPAAPWTKARTIAREASRALMTCPPQHRAEVRGCPSDPGDTHGASRATRPRDQGMYARGRRDRYRPVEWGDVGPFR